MKYITLLVLLAKVAEPLMAIYNDAVAAGKSTDPTAAKIKEILQDIDKGIETVLSAL